MLSVASEESFKKEFCFSAGAAIPLGNTRTFLPEGIALGHAVPQGANMGGSVKAGFRYYPLQQLYFGPVIFGHWYAYEYSRFDLSSANRVEHSGWGAYGAALEAGTYIPFGIYGLYFTANFQLGYAMMCSPKVSAIYSTRDIGDIEFPILRRSVQHNLYLGGGVGIQYRFRRHWLYHIGLEYAYMPTGSMGLDSPPNPLNNNSDLSLKLSSFVINAGLSYSF